MKCQYARMHIGLFFMDYRKDTIIGMNKYHKNPRVLTEKQFKLLERDLKELGDLSGIVHDINSNEIISGNQRVSVFTPSDNDIEIIEEFDPPTKTGTIATGWIKYNGERYSYRRVKWTPEKCEKANIVANKAGGSWDWDILANEFDFDSLKDWGFSDEELAGLDFGYGEDFTLPDGEKAGFQQMTFTLSDEQAVIVQDAIKKAKHNDFGDTGNENSNGNAIAWICGNYEQS